MKIKRILPMAVVLVAVGTAVQAKDYAIKFSRPNKAGRKYRLIAKEIKKQQITISKDGTVNWSTSAEDLPLEERDLMTRAATASLMDELDKLDDEESKRDADIQKYNERIQKGAKRHFNDEAEEKKPEPPAEDDTKKDEPVDEDVGDDKTETGNGGDDTSGGSGTGNSLEA